jgi:hypothetical protein
LIAAMMEISAARFGSTPIGRSEIEIPSINWQLSPSFCGDLRSCPIIFEIANELLGEADRVSGNVVKVYTAAIE